MADHAGLIEDLELGWFDAVHVIPRTAIDFGSIVSATQEDYLLHNAQDSNAVISAVTNSGSSHVTLPNLPSLPITIAPHTSLVDPVTSTALSPAELQVQAEESGPGMFDFDILFTVSPGGTQTLTVQGQRITLVNADWEGASYTETLSWITEVLEDQEAGTEQRISKRKQPRQSFRVQHRIDEEQRRLFESRLFAEQGGIFVIPLLEQEVRLTAAASATATLTVDSTAYLDLRIGGFVLIYASQATQETLRVESFTATTITLESNIQNSYSVDDIVWPARECRVVGDVGGGAYQTELADYDVTYQSIDNDTGALTGDTSPFSSYNSRVFLDDCNVMTGETKPHRYQVKVSELDGVAGKVFFEQLWSSNKRQHQKVWYLQDRQEVYEARRLLISLGGRWKQFYIPTFHEDMVPTAGITSGTNTLAIEHIDYTRHINGAAPRDIIRVSFNDGTGALTNTISSSTETSPTVETLTVGTNWGITKALSTIERIEYIEPVRIDSDDITIQHEQGGQAVVEFPVVVVFDS